MYTSRPYRRVSYGIFKVSDTGTTGTWDGPTPTFLCPPMAKMLGFEVEPQGNSADVVAAEAGVGGGCVVSVGVWFCLLGWLFVCIRGCTLVRFRRVMPTITSSLS